MVKTHWYHKFHSHTSFSSSNLVFQVFYSNRKNYNIQNTEGVHKKYPLGAEKIIYSRYLQFFTVSHIHPADGWMEFRKQTTNIWLFPLSHCFHKMETWLRINSTSIQQLKKNWGKHKNFKKCYRSHGLWLCRDVWKTFSKTTWGIHKLWLTLVRKLSSISDMLFVFG